MAGVRDFVPLVQYGVEVNVNPGVTQYIVLYPLPDLVGSDIEFLVEDNTESVLFLERVVGSVTLNWEDSEGVGPTGSAANAGWCLLPLGVDYSTLQVLEPFGTAWDWASSEWANVKWWDKRVRNIAGLVNLTGFEASQVQPSDVDIPYWTMVDIHPRMALGQDRNLWPVLAVRNRNANFRLTAVHYLRGFFK